MAASSVVLISGKWSGHRYLYACPAMGIGLPVMQHASVVSVAVHQSVVSVAVHQSVALPIGEAVGWCVQQCALTVVLTGSGMWSPVVTCGRLWSCLQSPAVAPAVACGHGCALIDWQ